MAESKINQRLITTKSDSAMNQSKPSTKPEGL